MVVQPILKKYLLPICLLIPVAVISFVRILIVHNIHKDEGYYLSTIYRISLGDSSFSVDVVDFFSFLISPLSNLFIFFTGGSDGYVYFFHLIYYASIWCVFFVCFFCLKKVISPFFALIISLAYPAYLHYYPILFYTNLGAGLFTACLFLIFLRLGRRFELFLPIILGALLGLSIISHPGGYLASSLCFLMILFLSRRYDTKSLVFSGIVIVFVVFSFFIVNKLNPVALVESAKLRAEYSKHDGMPLNFSKFLALGEWLFYSSPVKGFGLILNSLCVFVFLKKKKWAHHFVIWFWLPLTYLLVFRGVGSPTSFIHLPAMAGGGKGLIQYISLLGPLFYLFLGKKNPADQLLWYVWIPSFISALSLAFTSNTGPGNFGIGMLPAFMVSMIFLTLLIQECAGKISATSYVPVVALLILLVTYLFSGINLKSLERVEMGPFKGLYVTRGINQNSEQILKILKYIHSEKPGRILFECNPLEGYAYLFSKQKPGVTNTWPCQIDPAVCRRVRTFYSPEEISTLVFWDPCDIEPSFKSKFKLISSIGLVQVLEK